MLNTHSLTRSLAARDGVRLVRELERNGLPLGPVLAARLAPGWVIPTALGFRRLLEVSHRPSTAARAMLDELLDAQVAEGGFADPQGVDAAVVTAAALRALAAALADQRFVADRDRIGEAVARGVAALRRGQAPDGWFGSTGGFTGGSTGGVVGRAAGRLGDLDRRAAGALVCWLVGDEPALCGALDVPALEAAWHGGGEAGAAGVRGGHVRGPAADLAADLAADVRDLWSLVRASMGGAASHPRAA